MEVIAYLLEDLHVPLVARVPQAGNPWLSICLPCTNPAYHAPTLLAMHQPCFSITTFIRSSCTKYRKPTNTSTNYCSLKITTYFEPVLHYYGRVVTLRKSFIHTSLLYHQYNWIIHEENVLILPTFNFWITADIRQRKALLVQESKESFPKNISTFTFDSKEPESNVAIRKPERQARKASHCGSK